MTLQQAAKQRAKFITVKRELLSKNITSIERKLFDAILDKLIKELDVADGKIESNGKNINLTTALDKIIREFNTNEYANVIRLFADDLLEIQGLTKRYFLVMGEDKKKIEKISKTVNKTLNERLGIGEDGKVKKGGYLDKLANDPKLKETLKKATYNAVIKGKPIQEFKDKMSALIQGNKNVNGLLTKHMNTFAYDTYQQYDRTNSELFAKKLGLKAFLYNGGKIKTSREFCIQRNGKVFTIEEAMSWKNLEWDGKNKNYNPLQDAGGYGCRHTLDWISNAMAMRIRPELIPYFAQG